MAAKKKPNPGASKANASIEAPPSTNNALVPANNGNEDQDEDLEVDLTDGEFVIDLHDLGISAEDILAMKRIDARLTERLRNVQQAQAGPSNAPVTTRSKGKGRQLTVEELEE